MSKKTNIVFLIATCFLISTIMILFPTINKGSSDNTENELVKEPEEKIMLLSMEQDDNVTYKEDLENVPLVIEEILEIYIDNQYSQKKYAEVTEEIKNIVNIDIIEIDEEEKISHGNLTFTYNPNLEYINKDNIRERFAIYAPNDDFDKTVEALSKMGFGEAGGCSKTEIAATFWNVLNRYDANYAKSIYGVVTAPEQYHGYKAHHPVKDEIYDLCIDVLARWIAEKEGQTNVGRILPSDYYWFYGDGKHNHYRNVYRSNVRWDWSLPTPYAD